MEIKEALRAVKIALIIYLAYLAVNEFSNPRSIFGNSMWMLLIAVLAVAATFIFSSLLRGGTNY